MMLLPDCFRLRHRWNWVYCVFNADGECIYVGLTDSIGENGDRWKAHRRTNPQMVAEAARFRLIGPYTRGVAYRVEREQLLLRRPKYNKISRLLDNASRADVEALLTTGAAS